MSVFFVSETFGPSPNQKRILVQLDLSDDDLDRIRLQNLSPPLDIKQTNRDSFVQFKPYRCSRISHHLINKMKKSVGDQLYNTQNGELHVLKKKKRSRKQRKKKKITEILWIPGMPKKEKHINRD